MRVINQFITINPEIMFGKPVIKGSRIPVELILEKLANGETMEELLKSYPKISKKAIYACLMYAASIIKNDSVLSVA